MYNTIIRRFPLYDIIFGNTIVIIMRVFANNVDLYSYFT